MSRSLVVITDLDGTLLDYRRYQWEPAARALNALKTRQIDLVLASSKTKAEIIATRRALDHHGAFIVENGGALYIPDDLFPSPPTGAILRDRYHVIEFGTNYAGVRRALHDIAHTLGVAVQGFGDMTVAEVEHLTGLSPEEAALAKQREYDEPFLVVSGHVTLDDWRRAAAPHGLQCTRGGRFFHLLGRTSKGEAVRRLLSEYRAHRRSDLIAVGIGDSLNDLPLLTAVDIPVLVQQHDGCYDNDIHLPHLIRAHGIGPDGWGRALLDILNAA